jgi:prefoldin subunit 5
MNASLFELADQLKAARERKKLLDAEAKELASQIDELDRQLSEAMAEEEVDRFTRNGSLFYLTSRLFASPKAGEKDALIHALKENGYAGLVAETVNANTLSAFAKERMADSESGELPEWLDKVITTFEKISVGMRKD